MRSISDTPVFADWTLVCTALSAGPGMALAHRVVSHATCVLPVVVQYALQAEGADGRTGKASHGQALPRQGRR